VDTSRKAIVIHSPHSGRSAQLGDALTHLREAGIEITEVISIADLDGLPAQGARWQQDGIGVVIAAGGDGLIGGVITHIVESGLPLGILPLGTANDIARSLRIPQDLLQAVQVIANGAIIETDIGVARPSEQAPHLASKGQKNPVLTRVSSHKHGYFAHTVTIGLNVQFARIATNVATRQRYGRFTYPVAALETLKYHDALDITLQFEGLVLPQNGKPAPKLSDGAAEPNILHCRALQITVINAPIFGGQWNLSIPGASINDHLLDIVVVEQIEFARLNQALAHFLGIQSKGEYIPAANEYTPAWTRHPADLSNIPGLHHMQAKGVFITTNADPRDVTLDGEVRGQTPMYVHLAQERLRVIVPAPAGTAG